MVKTKNKVSGFIIFVNEKRETVPEWRDKSASELMQLCQSMWQLLLPQERQKYQQMKRKLSLQAKQMLRRKFFDGKSDEDMKEEENKLETVNSMTETYGHGGGGYEGGGFLYPPPPHGGGYGRFTSNGVYGGGYVSGPCGRYGEVSYDGNFDPGYGGVGGYGRPFGGSFGSGGGYGGPFGRGGYCGGGGYGGPIGGTYVGGGSSLASVLENIEQRKLKAKYEAQNKEIKSRALLHLPDTEVVQLEESLGKIKNMKDYEVGSASENSLLTNLQQNHEANARRTKGELPQLNQDYVTEEPLQKLPDIDLKLKGKNSEKATNQRYLKMVKFRKKLPAYAMREEMIDLIKNNQVVLVSGETGCGKTTQVPQFILDECISAGRGATCRIVCTQPRRIAATSVAERVANERGEALGVSVGFQVRLESRLPRKNGSILFCTTGVVLQWLRSVPLIDNVSHIVLDEIHERDILSDFLLAILKELLPRRPDLKLILMSATLNAEKFSKYFTNCPMVTIPGFTHPVEETYLEDVLEMTGFKFKPNERKVKNEKDRREFTKTIEPFLRGLETSGSYSKQTLDSLRSGNSENLNMELVAALISYIHDREKEGAILVFVPGWSEITQVHKLLLKDRKLQEDVVIYTLHSTMTSGYQREIFERPNEGVRKIILATNIAETSITVDDVVYVVDSGRIKVTNFDESANLNSLDTEWVSLANARQRRGRAGRVQEGKCFHLYTKARETLLDSYLLPEMQRSRLEEVILQIKLLELGDAKKFLEKVLDPPKDKTVTISMELLLTINAVVINNDGVKELTPLGFHLAKLPVDPFVGKMLLLGAIFCCLDPVLSIAASLSFKEPFVIPLGKEEEADEKRGELANNTMSDHLTIANALAGWETSEDKQQFCFEYFLSDSVMNMLHRLKQQYGQYVYQQQFLNSPSIWSMEANKNSQNEDLVRAVVCAGLYPNVAKLKMYQNPKGISGKEKTKLASKNDTNIKFHKKSVNEKVLSFPYPWVTYHQKMKSHSVSLHDSSVVSPLSLLLFGKHVKLGQDTMGGTGQKVDTVAADDYVKFNCEAATAGLVKELRGQLDELMLHKFTNPAPSNWSNSKKEGLLLDLIVELLGSELSPEISQRISASNNIADFFKLLSKTDDGELILVNSKVPTKLLLSDGHDARELLVKDENANEISSKRFSSSDAMFLLLRDNSTTVEEAQTHFQTEILHNKSVRNRISQLEREKEAGVISLQMKERETGVISLQMKESSVVTNYSCRTLTVLYCFPHSEFSTGLLKRAAAKFADEIKKEAYFVVVVMRGGDQPVFDSMEDLLTNQIKSTEGLYTENFTYYG